MRKLMKIKRIEFGDSIEECSKKLKTSRHNIYLIESGKRNGSFEFWINFQKEYKVRDEEMWNVIKGDDAIE